MPAKARYGRGVSQLRIATFNLLHGQPLAPDGAPLPFPPDPDDPATAAAALTEAVASLDADVLALQEVDRYQPRSGLVDQAAVAAEAMGAADWRFAAALHGRPAPVSGWLRDGSAPGFQVYGPAAAGTATALPAYGTALLTRLPVHHWRARRFAPAPFGLPLRVAGRRGLTRVPDEPRAALAAVLEGERGLFTAVAAHLSFVPGWNVAQLTAIRRWIADLPRPYLLLGDLNLVGAVPRTVLGGAAVVDGVAGGRHRRRWRVRREGVPVGAVAPATGPLPVAQAGRDTEAGRVKEARPATEAGRVTEARRVTEASGAGEAEAGPATEAVPEARADTPGVFGATLFGTSPVGPGLRGARGRRRGVRVRGSRRRLRDLREARRTRLARAGRDRLRVRRNPAGPLGDRLQGWRDLARTPTYPSHRPTVQFDHVLAVGLRPARVGEAHTPRTPISDHRPLLVRVDL